LRRCQPDPEGVTGDRLQCLAVNLRIADHPVADLLAAGLELRLHECNDLSAERTEARRNRAQDAVERDERDVDHCQVDGRGQDTRAEGAGVCPLHRYHPGIVPERLGKLTATHVHGVHLARVSLQEQVREAAG